MSEALVESIVHNGSDCDELFYAMSESIFQAALGVRVKKKKRNHCPDARTHSFNHHTSDRCSFSIANS